MASQVEMRGQETIAQARRPERLDTSGRMLHPHPREGVRTQPQLLSRQEIDTINKQLLAAGQTIETSRQRLYETRFVADSALQELEQERHVRQQCSDAYKEAHVQYGKKAAEAQEMAAKCVSLHKELEESQMTISNYELAFKGFENSIASGKLQLEDAAKDIERRTSELQVAMKRIQGLEKEVNKAVARECLAKETVSELEEERRQLDLALQKIHNLEKEREDAEQKNGARINEMIAREALAQQKITEQRQEMTELIRELQAAAAVATDRLNPTDGMPETKRAANPARGRPSKYRKCKDARKAEEEDTIVVYN